MCTQYAIGVRVQHSRAYGAGAHGMHVRVACICVPCAFTRSDPRVDALSGNKYLKKEFPKLSYVNGVRYSEDTDKEL